MSFKRGLWLFTVIFLCIGLAACSGGQPAGAPPQSNETNNESNNATNNEDSSEGNQENIEFRISWWGSTARHELINSIIDLYEEQNPNVKIVREYAAFDDYWDRLSTQAAGGNAPDIIQIHSLLYTREYVDRGVIIPLNEYVDKGIIQFDGWNNAIKDVGYVGDTLYHVSSGVTTPAFIFNKSMIERAGMEIPPYLMTYEEFKDYAVELQAKLPEGSYVINQIMGQLDTGIDTYVRNRGQSMFAEDGKSLGFDKQILVDWFAYWKDLQDAGVIPPVETLAEYDGMPWETSMLVKNVTVGTITNANQAKIFDMYTDDEVVLQRMPVVGGAPFVSGENLASSAFGISKDSDPAIRDELAKFINWFNNNEEAVMMFNAELGVIGPTEIGEKLKSTLEPADVMAFEHMEEIGDDIPPPESWMAGSSMIRTEMISASDRIMYGQMTVEEAADNFFQVVNAYLANQ